MFSSLEPRNSELKGWYKEEDNKMLVCNKINVTGLLPVCLL